MRRLILPLFVGILFATPLLTGAQTLIPQCGYDVNGNDILDSEEQCQACHAVELGQNIIEFLIKIAAFIAVFIFMYAGFLYVTAAGNPGQISKAHGMFTNVALGLVIVLAGWLIIDTVMKYAFQGLTENDEGSPLYEATKSFGPWNQINCFRQPETALDELPTVPPGTVGPYTDNKTAHTEAESRLAAAGIEVKDGASLEGIQSHVIDEIIALDQECGCDVLITEGTGGQHASGEFSHANGFKLDLRTRDNPDLISYVQSLPSAGSWSDGTPLHRDGCNTYAIEGNHIDVQFLPSCQR